jgi:putative transposase|tara:strand:+ start:53 stop:511 length:459 start_codon:yes stop_codon:yes gene_type:complete
MLSIKERKLIIQWNEKGKTQEEIAELLSCHQSSVSRFLRKYKQKRTIKNLPRSGRPTKLTEEKLSQLKDKILTKIKSANDKYCSVSTKRVKKLVHQEIGEDYSMRHIERIMHKLGFSLITPRPQHLRHDQEKVDNFRDEFKKNLKRSMWIMN